METRVFNSFMMGLDLVPGEQSQPSASQGSSHKHYEASPMTNQPGHDGHLAPRL